MNLKNITVKCRPHSAHWATGACAAYCLRGSCYPRCCEGVVFTLAGALAGLLAGCTSSSSCIASVQVMAISFTDMTTYSCSEKLEHTLQHDLAPSRSCTTSPNLRKRAAEITLNRSWSQTQVHIMTHGKQTS